MNDVEALLTLVRPATSEVSPAVRAELEELVGARILGPARAIGYDLPLLGVSKNVPNRPIYSRTPSGSWFYGTDYRADPAAARYGGISPVPEPVLETLDDQSRAGVRPTDLWIIHEIEAAWRPGEPLPATVPPAKAVRRHDELLVGVTERLKRGLLVGGAAIGGLAAAPAALLAAAGNTAIGLDPIILGGVRHPAGPCAWVALASWQWE